ncbi:MAG TPA: hypothetical protein VHM70_09660 [Polyangiaceae bacterium]|jgi:hypothetical protein|nr:hypothetical protein [Polyangiaceae bacterium]
MPNGNVTTPPPSPVVERASDAEGRPPSAPRQTLPTLPDGVPSMLWEDAVESERFLAHDSDA